VRFIAAKAAPTAATVRFIAAKAACVFVLS
jgi:hypothetical protein